MINDAIYELLNELGLTVSDENYITFQSGEMLKFNGKDIRFSYEDKFITDSTKEIWFDPINNYELIKNLYNYYTRLHYDETHIKIISTKEIQDSKSFKHKLNVIFYDEKNVKGEMNTIFYNNINIGYIQIILLDVMEVSELDNN